MLLAQYGYYNTAQPPDAWSTFWAGFLSFHWVLPLLIIVAVIWTVSASIKVVQAYERAVVFRFGRFARVAEPGLMILVPFIEQIYWRPDMRTQSLGLSAEGVVTKDMVQLDVSAVAFWRIVDPQKASLNIVGTKTPVSLLATSALREIVGASTLEESLSNRAVIGNEVLDAVKARVAEWGYEVQSIEVRDVTIPKALANALSQSAQAERERQARVLLAQAEQQVTAVFVDAAKAYIDNPIALELRRMNILYEGLKTDNTKFIVIPSSIASALSQNGAPSYKGALS